MAIECNKIKECGVVAKHDNGSTLELNFIAWGSNEPRYDLRTWSKGYALGGITMTEDDLKALSELIKGIKPKKKPAAKKETSAVAEKKPISISEKKFKKVESKATSTEEVSKKDNIIKFPKPRPEIEKLKTDGNASFEDCKEKLGKEKEIYVDPDSQYVIDGLLELCHVDADFRNNVMREDKNYLGVLNYMMKMGKEGYGYGINGGCFIDRDLGLGMAIDYFNSKPEEKKPVEKKTAKIEAPKKRTRKKKEVG